MDLGLASLIGSGISAAANIAQNNVAFEHQKELNKLKYKDLISAMQGAGASPTAIIQALGGSGSGTIPTASTSNNPVPDLGQTLTNAVTSSASQKEAAAAQDQASAALTHAETERQLALMKLRFEPAKYFADIRKSLAEAFESTKNAFLHGSMKMYYDELTKDVQQVRPWKLASLRQGLLNDMATFGKILQETKTSKAQEGYFNTSSDLNTANAAKAYSETLNESLRGFRLQWENTLLSYGIDPTKPFWENSARLMFSEPQLFKKRMDMFIGSLNAIDNRIQQNLGEHYKRNAVLGYGLYKLNQIHQKNANSRSYRFSNGVGAISKIIPMLGGAPISVDMSTKGVDWWMKD